MHPERARITCGAALTVDTDGPVRVVFAGCGRSEAFSGAGTFRRAGAACASTAGFRRATVRPRGRGLRVAFSRALRRKVTVDVLRHSRGAQVLGTVRRVERFAARTKRQWPGRAGTPPPGRRMRACGASGPGARGACRSPRARCPAAGTGSA